MSFIRASIQPQPDCLLVICSGNFRLTNPCNIVLYSVINVNPLSGTIQDDMSSWPVLLVPGAVHCVCYGQLDHSKLQATVLRGPLYCFSPAPFRQLRHIDECVSVCWGLYLYTCNTSKPQYQLPIRGKMVARWMRPIVRNASACFTFLLVLCECGSSSLTCLISL